MHCLCCNSQIVLTFQVIALLARAAPLLAVCASMDLADYPVTVACPTLTRCTAAVNAMRDILDTTRTAAFAVCMDTHQLQVRTND